MDLDISFDSFLYLHIQRKQMLILKIKRQEKTSRGKIILIFIYASFLQGHLWTEKSMMNL